MITPQAIDNTQGGGESAFSAFGKVNSNFAASFAAINTAASTYTAPLTGSVGVLVSSKLLQTVSVLDFAGADPTGGSSSTAAFLAAANASKQVTVPAGTYQVSAFTPSQAMTWVINDGVVFSGTNNIPVADAQVKFGAYVNTWVNSVGGGVFEYLELQSAFNVRPHLSGIGIFVSGRTSTSPSPGVGAINYSSFAYNDNTSVAADVWGYYMTALRVAGANGHTHGMELDILNTGALVQMAPGQNFPAGLTDCLWVAAGGEFASTAGTVNPATCAIGIIQNDSSNRATFDKGIIFQNTAINGATGASGTGIAIAMATGHVLQWFNNSNVGSAYVYAVPGLSGANGTGIVFANAGTTIVETAGGTVQAAFAATPSAVNHVSITGSTTGNAVKINAQGSDATIDLFLTGQGGGSFVQLGAAFTSVSDPATTGYITVKDITGVVRKLAIIT
jgi:hypothetical protein